MSKRVDALREVFSKGYRVSPDGVYVLTPTGSRLNGCVVKGKINYRCFTYRLDNSPRHIPFHRLQAYQKYGEKALIEGVEVRHYNGKSLDNSWDNILIGSPRDNQLDRSAESRMQHSLNAAKKLRRFSIEQVRDMRDMKEAGVILRVIGEKYGIGKGHVSDLVNNKFYKETLA